MIIEKAMALGASILFFPEGTAVQAGGNCSSAAIPAANDPGWVDFQRVESWDWSRKDAKYEAVKDGSTGRLKLVDEEETDGYNEYKFTTNAILAFIIGVFLRAGDANGNTTPLTAASYQFNPNAGETPAGWLILVNKDARGNVIFAANLWGRMKIDALKGGGGALSKPDLTFTEYDNALNVASLGTQG